MVKDSDVVNLQRTSVLFYPITYPASRSILAVSSELHVDQSVSRYGQREHIGVSSSSRIAPAWASSGSASVSRPLARRIAATSRNDSTTSGWPGPRQLQGKSSI